VVSNLSFCRFLIPFKASSLTKLWISAHSSNLKSSPLTDHEMCF
jgi:hypothetical protein